MREHAAHEREMVVAWDGWPVPELLAGALVGSILGLVVVAVPPGLSRTIPDVAGLAIGALVGAVLSYVWRPRRITARGERTLTREEQIVRARAA